MVARKEFGESVARALVRDEIDPADLSSWIRRGTKRINEEMRVGEMLKHKVLPITAHTFAAPEDFLHARDVRLGVNVGPEIGIGPSRGALIYAPPSRIAEYSARSDLAGRAPGYFTTHGRTFEITPWAIKPGFLQIGLWYFAKVPALGDDPAATNLLTEEFEDLFLNAVLIYGHRHFYEDDRALLKDGLVSQEIQRLNVAYENARHGDGPLVMAPPQKMGWRNS